MKSDETCRWLGVLVAAVCTWALAGCGDRSDVQTVEKRQADRSTLTDVQIVEMRQADNSTLTDLHYGTSQWLYPLAASREKLASEPTYKSTHPIYYAAVYGDSPDNVFTLVIDESRGTGAGFDTLYVDANNDNRIAPETERLAFPMSTVREEHPVPVTFHVTSGGRTAPYTAGFTAFQYSDDKGPQGIHANLRNGSYYVGEAVIGGKTRKIAVADLNSNGLFNDPEVGGVFRGDRFFVDLYNNGYRDEKGRSGGGGLPYGELMKIDGRWYRLVVRPDGGEVRISAATPLLGKVEAAPTVASVRLYSKAQPCVLDFTGGAAEGLAGTYGVYSIRLEAKDAEGRTWQTSGAFPKDSRPQLTILANRTVPLKAGGPPLRLEPTVARGENPETLMLGLSLKGSAGEIYHWYMEHPTEVRPGVEVRDASGRLLVSASLSYG